MKLAISNIAWLDEEDYRVLSTLQHHQVKGVEIAPTRIWPNWHGATEASAVELKNRMNDFNLSIPAMQAVLYNKPECKLFGNVSEQKAFKDHLKFIADIAASLGASNVVLGAPQNRQLHGLDTQSAKVDAIKIFFELGEFYRSRHVHLCIEPNPIDYHCNFIVNAKEGADLVTAVNSPGFKLHLDSAALYLAKDLDNLTFENINSLLKHFHVSEPYLNSFDQPEVPHKNLGDLLSSSNYNQWISIEMRAQPNNDSLPTILRAIQYVKTHYKLDN